MYKHACNKWFFLLFCPRPTGCGFMCGVHLLPLSNRCWNFKHIFLFWILILATHELVSPIPVLFFCYLCLVTSIIFLFKHSTSSFFFCFWISSSFLKKNFIVCFSQLGFLPFQLLFLMKYQWFNFTSLLFLLNFPRNLFFLLPCLLPFGGIIQKCNNQNFYLSRSYKYCIQVKGISSNIYVFK